MNTAGNGFGGRREERLVYSVAEAGALRGISRAFAYELWSPGAGCRSFAWFGGVSSPKPHSEP